MLVCLQPVWSTDCSTLTPFNQKVIAYENKTLIVEFCSPTVSTQYWVKGRVVLILMRNLKFGTTSWEEAGTGLVWPCRALSCNKQELPFNTFEHLLSYMWKLLKWVVGETVESPNSNTSYGCTAFWSIEAHRCWEFSLFDCSMANDPAVAALESGNVDVKLLIYTRIYVTFSCFNVLGLFLNLDISSGFLLSLKVR